MDVWYAGADRFTLEVIAPDGTSVATVPPGQNRTLTFQNRVVMFLANRLNDPNNGDNMIGLFLEPELPAGRWIVRLHGDAVHNGAFHAWIERDDFGQSSFEPPLDSSRTLGSISCGRETIVVGSYQRQPPKTRDLCAWSCGTRRTLAFANRRHQKVGHQHGGARRHRRNRADAFGSSGARTNADDRRYQRDRAGVRASTPGADAGMGPAIWQRASGSQCGGGSGHATADVRCRRHHGRGSRSADGAVDEGQTDTQVAQGAAA
jgi:hypothetical protein